jgi:hypothetical protein
LIGLVFSNFEGEVQWLGNGGFWSPRSPFWGQPYRRVIATTAVAILHQRLAHLHLVVLAVQVTLLVDARRVGADQLAVMWSPMVVLEVLVDVVQRWSNRPSWNRL